MPDTTGRIRAKALDQTGITEPMLERDWGTGAGRVRLAIVELRTVEPHGPNLDGKRRIDYVIELIEPVPDAQEETVREFMRAVYRTRPEVEGQEALSGTGDTGPSVADAADALGAQIARDDDGIITGVWNGDLDAPLTPPEDEQPTVGAVVDEVKQKRGRKAAAAKPAVEPPPVPEGGYCPFPGCGQANEHDGEHDDPSDDDEPEA